MPKIIEARWDEYRRELIRKGVAVPLKEAREAFYSGAAAAVHVFLDELSYGPEPTKEDAAIIASIDGEVGAFEKSIERGEEEEG